MSILVPLTDESQRATLFKWRSTPNEDTRESSASRNDMVDREGLRDESALGSQKENEKWACESKTETKEEAHSDALLR